MRKLIVVLALVMAVLCGCDPGYSGDTITMDCGNSCEATVHQMFQ